MKRFSSVCALSVACVLGPTITSAETSRSRSTTDISADENETSPETEVSADIDKLLNLDLQSLTQTSVLVSTTTDPLVESVSKTAEKASEAPGIVQVITAKDIEQFGAKNLYEVLQRGTSVFMTGSFLFPRNVASIRGNLQNHEDNHVLVLINGRPFRDITLGGINTSIYTAFPIHTIERIEVIRGPGSALYGTNAFNGVINLVTKNPTEPMLHASTLQGSYDWQSYSVAAGNGSREQGAYAGATYSRQSGWPFTATEDLAAPPPLDTDTAPWGEDNIGVFAMYRRGDFTANLFVANATQEMLGSDGSWPSKTLKVPRVFCDLGYDIEIDDWQSLQTNFTYNYDATHFPSVLATPTEDFPFKAPSQSFLLESTYHAELTDDLNFMLGGLADIHQGRATIQPLGIPSVPAFTEIWYGVYMQLDYRVVDWLKLVGGMQANLPGDIKSGIVPRFGAIATFSDHWTGKFLYGQAFRSPYAIERTINVPGILIGNPGLIPETIQTFDVQLAYRTDDFRLAATYFHSDYFDIVSRVGFPQTYVNQGSMIFDGVELENEWKMNDKWRWLGSMTYQRNKRDDVSNTTSAPNWMAKMGLAYHHKGVVVGLFDTYFGDQVVPAGAVPLNVDPQPYHLMSLNTTIDLNQRLEWNSGASIQVQFLVQNLLDEGIHHVEFERELVNSFPAGPGRTYYGGFTVDY